MTKSEYLDLLRFYLRELPPGVIHDIVKDYEDHFEEGLAAGKTEEQIVRDLGSPKDIAEEIILTEFRLTGKGSRPRPERQSEPNINNTRHYGIGRFAKVLKYLGMGLLAIILFFPLMGVLMGLFGGIFGLLIGFLGLIFGVSVGGVTMMLSALPVYLLPASFVPSGMALVHPFTKIFLGIGLIGMAILLFQLFIRLVKWIVRSIRQGITSLIWEYKKRRRSA